MMHGRLKRPKRRANCGKEELATTWVRNDFTQISCPCQVENKAPNCLMICRLTWESNHHDIEESTTYGNLVLGHTNPAELAKKKDKP